MNKTYTTLDDFMRFSPLDEDIRENIAAIVNTEVDEAIAELNEKHAYKRETIEELLDILDDRLDAMTADSIATGLVNAIRDRL